MFDSSFKNIFVFWESKKTRPGYLDACLETWYKSIDNLKVHIINYANIHSYIGDIYDVEKLKQISLPKQSDAVSAAVLEKFGGLFIDMDTIITKNVFEIFEKIDPAKLVFFGYPPNRGVHVAVMYAGNSNNPVLSEWRKQCQYKLDNLDLDTMWSSFGNSIVDPLLKDEKYKDYYHVIDCVTSGNILERCLTSIDARKQYETFYFSENLRIDAEHFSDYPRDGMISLHNSWTPEKYKCMSKNEFLNTITPLAEILNHVNHKEEIKKLNYLSGIIYFYFRESEFFKKNRIIKNKKIVVIDFVLNKCQIGFDLKFVNKENNEKVTIEMVARNEATKNVLGNNFFFPEGKNKANLGECQLDFVNLTLRQFLNKILTIN